MGTVARLLCNQREHGGRCAAAVPSGEQGTVAWLLCRQGEHVDRCPAAVQVAKTQGTHRCPK